MSDYSYVGSGKIYLREAGSSAGLLPVGNCSALSFSVTEETKELKDFTNPGGGTYNEIRKVSSVEASISAHDFSPENLAKALFGNTSGIVAGAVTGESVALYKGALAPTLYQIDESVTPVVESVAGNAAGARANTTAVTLGQYLVPATPNGFYYKVTTPGSTGGTIPTFPTTPGATVTDGTAVLTCMGRIALAIDTDFTVSGSGLVLVAAARITDGEAYEIDYTKKAGDIVQALTNSAKEYEMVFEGLNEARSGKPVTLHVYRLKLGAAANLGFIGEDYGVLEMAGKVLKDTSKTGTGVSQYFKVKLAA